jgi:hypothetical protein
MPITADRNLTELIDIADVSIRTASQLRLMSTGRPPSDRQSLSLALEFLNQAKLGGDLLSAPQGTQVKKLSSLKPLNWATDTYLRTEIAGKSDQVDYPRLVEYLSRLARTMERVLLPSGPGASPSPEEIAPLLQFFQELGRLLSNDADKRLRERSPRPQRENEFSRR